MCSKSVDRRYYCDLFRTELSNLTNHRQEPVKLAELLDWHRSKSLHWQHFGGARHFPHELQHDPSSLVGRCQRTDEAGCEWLLTYSVMAAAKGRVIERASLAAVVLNATM